MCFSNPQTNLGGGGGGGVAQGALELIEPQIRKWGTLASLDISTKKSCLYRLFTYLKAHTISNKLV